MNYLPLRKIMNQIKEERVKLNQKDRNDAIARIELLTDRLRRSRISPEQYRKEVSSAMTCLDDTISYNEYLKSIGQI